MSSNALAEKPAYKVKPTLLAFFVNLRPLLSQKWIKFSARLSITLLIVIVLLKQLSWAGIQKRIEHMDSGLFAVSLIVGLAGVIVSAYQWQSLLEGEHIHIDLKKLVNFYLIGVMFNNFLPTGMGGDVVKSYYVGKENGNHSGSASAVIMSRVTGFFGMLLLSLFVALGWQEVFTPAFLSIFFLSSLAICAALGSVFALVIILPRYMHRWIKGRFLASRLGPLLRVSVALHKGLLRPKTLGKATVFGILFHVTSVMDYYCLAKALHINNVPLTFYFVAIPLVSLIAFLPISINGYGLREAAMIGIFSNHLLNIWHISQEVTLVLSSLMELQVFLFGILGGGIYLAMRLNKPKRVAVPVTVQPQELTA